MKILSTPFTASTKKIFYYPKKKVSIQKVHKVVSSTWLLVVCAFAIHGTGCATYSIGDKKFNSRSAAEREAARQDRKNLSEIIPTTSRVGGRALVVIPSLENIEKNGILYGTNISRNGIEFLKQHAMNSNEYMFNALSKRQIFDDVDLTHNNNPLNIDFSAFDSLIFISNPTPHQNQWFYMSRGLRTPVPLKLDMQKSVGVPRTVAWLDSIEVLARSVAESEIGWRSVESENTIAAYERFIDLYPNSCHTKKARSALKELTVARDWKLAIESPSAASFYEYIERHPSTDHAAEASKQLAKISESWPGTIPLLIPEDLRSSARQAFAAGKKCFIWQDANTKVTIDFRRRVGQKAEMEKYLVVSGLAAIAAPSDEGALYCANYAFLDGSGRLFSGVQHRSDSRVSSGSISLVEIAIPLPMNEKWSGKVFLHIHLSDELAIKKFVESKVSIPVSNKVILDYELP